MTGAHGAADDEVARYLCGELSADESARVEERLFTEPAFLGQVEDAENDWLDAYAAGTLTPRERGRFERGYLISDERRQRAAFAQALHRARRVRAAALRPPRVSAWAALAAAALALAVVLPRREPPARAQVAKDAAVAPPARVPTAGAASLAGAPPAPARSRPLILLLAAAAVRGESRAATPTLRLAAADEVVLQAPLDFEPDPGARFDVTLETVEGRVLWSRTGARAQPARGGPRVSVSVPKTAWRPGDLVVRLRLVTPGAPAEDAGSFLLRVLAD